MACTLCRATHERNGEKRTRHGTTNSGHARPHVATNVCNHDVHESLFEFRRREKVRAIGIVPSNGRKTSEPGKIFQNFEMKTHFQTRDKPKCLKSKSRQEKMEDTMSSLEGEQRGRTRFSRLAKMHRKLQTGRSRRSGEDLADDGKTGSSL